MVSDPFSFKALPKFNPKRLWFTVKARIAEAIARNRFSKYEIQLCLPSIKTECQPYTVSDTAVSREQMTLLLYGISKTECMDSPIVEIGAYRGVTTQVLASNTKRDFFAIDPYIGYGGAEADYASMQKRISGLSNVEHLKMTSGEAFRSKKVPKCSFVFIDAVHDYVNVHFDATIWGSVLDYGGILAFHDVDSRDFPGVQRAVWKALNHRDKPYQLLAHCHGLILLEKVCGMVLA